MKILITLQMVFLLNLLNAQICLKSVNNNIVYLSLDNKLEISSKFDLTFITDNGEIKKGNNGYYYYKPTKLGFPTINIMSSNGESIELKFHVIDFPKPQVLLEQNNILPRNDNKYIDRNTYPKEKIKEFPLLTTILSNFNFDVRLNVVNYQLKYLNSKTSSIQTISSDNYKFYLNPQIKQIVDNANPGDIFMISKILTDNNVNENLKYADSIYFIVSE